MRYTDRRGKTITRTIYTLSAGGGRVVAHCFLRNQVRTFLRRRMEILHQKNVPLSP